MRIRSLLWRGLTPPNLGATQEEKEVCPRDSESQPVPWRHLGFQRCSRVHESLPSSQHSDFSAAMVLSLAASQSACRVDLVALNANPPQYFLFYTGRLVVLLIFDTVSKTTRLYESSDFRRELENASPCYLGIMPVLGRRTASGSSSCDSQCWRGSRLTKLPGP